MKIDKISKLPAVEDEPTIEIDKWPILKALYAAHLAHLKDPEAKMPEGIFSELEIEQRFWVDLDAAGVKDIQGIDDFFDRLLDIPGAYERSIHQVNVSAYKDASHKNRERFRLRITERLPGKSPESIKLAKEEGKLFRIAIKSDVKDQPAYLKLIKKDPELAGAKIETQLRLRMDDPKVGELRKQFMRLFSQKGELENHRRRINIHVTFGNGETGDVHTEKYAMPVHLTDQTRGEIEAHSAAGYRWVREHSHELFPWVGENVTDDPRAKSRAMVRDGAPPEQKAILERLKAESVRRHQKEGK